MTNVQNMQNSLLLTERTSTLWAVYGYFSTRPPRTLQATQPHVNSVNHVDSVRHVNSVNSVNSYCAVLPPSPMVFFSAYV